MNVIVPMMQTVDLVEELELNDDGTDVEREYLKFVSNEWDEQALEEALLVKEAVGGTITVVGLDEVDIDQTLYAAVAKGADRAVKLTGDFQDGVRSHQRAAILADWLAGTDWDLVLMGVQSPEDIDGQAAALLAGRARVPHAAVAIGVEPKGDSVVVRQEHGGGVVHELELRLPAVVGVQAARQSPRYVPISRIRSAMQEGGLDEVAAAPAEAGAGISVRRLFEPEKSGQAEMLGGGADDVAGRIVEIVRERGLVKS